MLSLHGVTQGSPEWHTLRSGRVTASNAHKLLSRGKEEAMKPQMAFSGNFYTERGHRLEDEAIELYEAIINMTVARVGFITNDKYPDCGYSPDGILPDRLIEVKAFNGKKHTESYMNIPSEVLAQVHFGLMITELPVAVLIFYNPDIDPIEDNFLLKVIGRDQKIIENFERRLA